MTVTIPGYRLANIIPRCRSWRGVCRALHLRPSARMRSALIAEADRLGIAYDHFTTSHNAGRTSRRSGLIITE